MRPPWSYPIASWLLPRAETAEELYAILARRGCLLPRAQAERGRVVGMLGQARETHRMAVEQWERSHGMSLGDEGPELYEAVADALRRAGDLDERGWSLLMASPGYEASQASAGDPYAQELAEIRAELQASGGSLGPSPGDTVICGTCGRQLPRVAVYCGYCGIRVAVR